MLAAVNVLALLPGLVAWTNLSLADQCMLEQPVFAAWTEGLLTAEGPALQAEIPSSTTLPQLVTAGGYVDASLAPAACTKDRLAAIPVTNAPCAGGVQGGLCTNLFCGAFKYCCPHWLDFQQTMMGSAEGKRSRWFGTKTAPDLGRRPR